METIDTRFLLGVQSAMLTGIGPRFLVDENNTATLSSTVVPLTVSVTEPAHLAGTYPFTPSDLGTGPVSLKPPGVVGSAQSGNPLEVRPALWAYAAPQEPPTRSWQWQSDGLDIPGATGTVFTPGASEVGTDVRVIEYASGANGTQATPSLVVTISA